MWLKSLMMEKLLELFMNKNLKKIIEFKIQKGTKMDKLYVQWKAYDNLLNSWINTNDIVQWINVLQNCIVVLVEMGNL